MRLCAVPRPPESNKENAAPFRVDRDLALELTDAELAFIEDTEAAHSPPALQAHVKDTKAPHSPPQVRACSLSLLLPRQNRS